MKFSDLRIIQQIAILTDIAGLVTNNSHYGKKQVEPSDKLKEMGIRRPQESIRNATGEVIFLPDSAPDKNDRMSHWSHRSDETITFFGTGSKTEDKVRMRYCSADGKEIAPDLNLDPYGLSSNIVFSGDLEHNLTKAATFIDSMEAVLEKSSGTSEILHTLASVYARANALPSEVIDLFYINKEVALRLHYIARGLSTLDNTRNEHFGYGQESDTENSTPKQPVPAYRVAFEYANRYTIQAGQDFINNTGVTLEVTFGEMDTDEVVIGYKVAKQRAIIIERYIPDGANLDMVQFITDLCDYIEAACSRHIAANDLKPLTTHLTSLLTINAPFIARNMESEDSGDSIQF